MYFGFSRAVGSTAPPPDPLPPAPVPRPPPGAVPARAAGAAGARCGRPARTAAAHTGARAAVAVRRRAPGGRVRPARLRVSAAGRRRVGAVLRRRLVRHGRWPPGAVPRTSGTPQEPSPGCGQLSSGAVCAGCPAKDRGAPRTGRGGRRAGRRGPRGGLLLAAGGHGDGDPHGVTELMAEHIGDQLLELLALQHLLGVLVGRREHRGAGHQDERLDRRSHSAWLGLRSSLSASSFCSTRATLRQDRQLRQPQGTLSRLLCCLQGAADSRGRVVLGRGGTVGGKARSPATVIRAACAVQVVVHRVCTNAGAARAGLTGWPSRTYRIEVELSMAAAACLPMGEDPPSASAPGGRQAVHPSGPRASRGRTVTARRRPVGHDLSLEPPSEQAHLPAEQPPPRQDPRLPSAHAHPRRPRDPGDPPCARAARACPPDRPRPDAVLPTENRLRRRQDFATAVRRGRRAGRPLLVVHLRRTPRTRTCPGGALPRHVRVSS